jgi:hypothetical protein
MALPCVREKALDKPMTLPLCQKSTQHTKRHMAEHTKKTIIACRGEEKQIITLPCAEKSR